MSHTPLLQVVDLSKSFGGVRALHHVSFDLKPGELLGVIGPNGSGKTTLVNLITRFVRPTSGKVLFKGHKISHLPPYKIVRLGIARTFQMVKPFYQLPAFKNMIIPLYSPRMKKLAGGRYGDRMPWPWICWRKSDSSGTPTWPTRWPAPCPRDT